MRKILPVVLFSLWFGQLLHAGDGQGDRIQSRLYGIIKLETIYDNTEVVQGDWLLFVRPGNSIYADRSVFTMNVRHSRLGLDLESPDAWQPNIPGYGKMEVKAGADGGVSFPITFEGRGDRWCYPRADFVAVQDWSQYQALAFEFRFDTDDAGTSARAQVVEAGGSSYICPAQSASKEWTRVVALFGDMTWGPFSQPDPDKRLDLDQIGRLMIGCNTKLDRLTFDVRNVELLAFD